MQTPVMKIPEMKQGMTIDNSHESGGGSSRIDDASFLAQLGTTSRQLKTARPPTSLSRLSPVIMENISEALQEPPAYEKYRRRADSFDLLLMAQKQQEQEQEQQQQ